MTTARPVVVPQSDIDTINRLAVETAERLQWCGEFDVLIDQINAQTQVLKLPGRRPPVHHTATIIVEVPMGRGPLTSDAQERGRNIAGRIESTLRSGGWGRATARLTTITETKGDG